MSQFRLFPLAAVLATFFVAALLWSLKIHFYPSLSILPHSPSRLDIVLAHFDENPDEVRHQIELIKHVPVIAALNPRVVIYTKGPMTSTSEADIQLEVLRTRLGADIIRVLPNQGRESDTYLTHIVDRYHDLAEHTFFGQADLDKPDLIPPRLMTHFNTTVGVMSLAPHSSCQCEQCIPRWGAPAEGFKRLPQLFSIFNEQFCPPDGLLVTFRGQFIVSRDRVHRNSREKYKWLLQTLGNMSHFVHDDYPSDPWFDDWKALDNPKFAHTVERTWLFMFGCNDVAIAEECEWMDYKSESTRCACYDE